MNSDRTRLRVAIYARVSSDRQKEGHTIASQLEVLRQRVLHDGFTLDAESSFVDEGYSGITLLRPALERLRDQAAAGALDRLYIHSPDRLARQYAHQYLLLEEFRRGGLDVVFLNRPLGNSPEDELLLQVQGIIAEYERTKIVERGRRGKLHSARLGHVSALSVAPYGYRYICKQEGSGQARYEIVWEEARVVQQIFTWVGQERLPIRGVCRRLQQQGVPSPTGKPCWDAATVAYLLKNPAYTGVAAFGKKRSGPRRPRLRPQRGSPATPRRDYATYNNESGTIPISVPMIVAADLFAAVAEQLAANRDSDRDSGTFSILLG